jgi:hypothetical protein
MSHYTSESVRATVEPHRERLFAPYAAGRLPHWSCDLRTKDLVVLGNWLQEELVRLGCNDDDRRTQIHFYNRWSRSDWDLFELVAEALNAVLDGTVEQGRESHPARSDGRRHRWG